MIKGRYASVYSSFVDQSEIKRACIEVSILNGLPTVEMVGLCDSSIRESKQRIRSALKHSGYLFPAARVVISISPAYIKKTGSSFDLPIAIAVLMASEQINTRKDCVAAMGELSLTGFIKDTPGTIARLQAFKDDQSDALIIPAQAFDQAKLVGRKVCGVAHLKDAVNYLLMDRLPSQCSSHHETQKNEDEGDCTQHIDFSILKGQEKAGRAILLAAAGFHNTILTGSPGSGKTIAAQIIKGILPPLSREEKIQMLGVVGCNTRLTTAQIKSEQRPFYKLSPTCTLTEMHGRSNKPFSGALAQAVHGVLFLDEMAEFSPRVLDSLRIILEEKQRISGGSTDGFRLDTHRFLFIGAMNPCRCGQLLDMPSKCICTTLTRRQYMQRISGAVLDRIDIFCQMYRINRDALLQSLKSENLKESITLRDRVRTCWSIQKERKTKCMSLDSSELYLNGEIMSENWQEIFSIPSSVMEYAVSAGERLNLSARGVNRMIRVARTIADLDERQDLDRCDVSEALQYRMTGFNAISGG